MPYESHITSEAEGVSVLSGREAGALRSWVVAANAWAETSQSLVGDATDLATVSRDLADVFDDDRRGTRPRGGPVGPDRAGLAADLRVLATSLEDQTSEFRDRYLATATDLEAYHSILG